MHRRCGARHFADLYSTVAVARVSGQRKRPTLVTEGRAHRRAARLFAVPRAV